MRIGLLGTGDVGRALGHAFVTLGHNVKMGSRGGTNEKAAAWAKEMGAQASVGTFADAASYGEIVVLATLGRNVKMGSRGGTTEKAAAWAKEMGAQAAAF